MPHKDPTKNTAASVSLVGSTFSVESHMVAFFLLFSSILLVYSNTLDVPWHFDDRRNIVERQELHLTELSWESIKNTFYYNNRLYRPVACLTFALNYYFHQLELAGYHAINIAIHVIAAWFLFLFVKVTLSTPLTQPFYRNKSFFIALLASLFWALHPIQTQSVTYIVQRMASLAGMFYIMSMYLYARGRIHEQGRRKWVFFFLSLSAGLLALGSKENAILLPFSIVLYEFIVLNRTPVKQLLKTHWKPLLVLAAAMTLVVFGCVTLYYGGRVPGFFSGYQNRIFSMEERLLTQPRIIIFYISLLLYPLPSRLSICHNVEVSASLFQPVSTFLSIGTIALLVAGAFIFRKKSPLTAFSVLFFFLNHGIESTFIPLELVFEHRNYIPSMLFFLPFAMLAAKGIFHPRIVPAIRGCSIALAIAIPLALGSASYLRNFDWQTGKRLWMDAAAKSPNSWRPFHNVGSELIIEEDYPEALKWLHKALEKKNTTGLFEKQQTLFGIGVAYQAIGLPEAALNVYTMADELYPGFAKVHVNMGDILMNLGDWSDALNAFNEALLIEPSMPEAHSNLGWLLFKTGDSQIGLAHLRKAVSLNTNDLPTLKRLAYVLLQEGNHSESEQIFWSLRKKRQEDFSPLLFIAEIHQLSGRPAQAKNALRLLTRLLGKDALSRLSRLVVEQEDGPVTMLPSKDTLIPLIEELKSE